MRASDADREAVAETLRDAHAEGRLTLEEFEERLDRALAAKTVGELAAVTPDLPTRSASIEAATTPLRAPATPYAGRGHVRGLWAAWGTAAIVSVVIWAATSMGQGHGSMMSGRFWPIWVVGPWGAVLLVRTLFGGERERPGRQDGERDHL
jgi:Domain of unknown function (DUF1707)